MLLNAFQAVAVILFQLSTGLQNGIDDKDATFLLVAWACGHGRHLRHSARFAVLLAIRRVDAYNVEL